MLSLLLHPDLKRIKMSAATPVHESEIKINVSLDADKRPVGLRWSADDAGMETARDARSMMLAFWDREEKSTMRIDLWTNEMTVEEMQFFFYEALASMADTYQRATSDTENATSMRNFAREFGKKTNVIK
jgi:gliding motility-associated protein GldC